MIRTAPNLLLLDEPTNHLDLEMREALTIALQETEAGMVLVSHDRHLLRATCDELWLVADGKVTPFDGDLDDYADWLNQSRAAEKSAESRQEPGAAKPAAAAVPKKGDAGHPKIEDRKAKSWNSRSPAGRPNSSCWKPGSPTRRCMPAPTAAAAGRTRPAPKPVDAEYRRGRITLAGDARTARSTRGE
jgi:energy-coupling factor transporter ATP-binding protein EcfA2